MLVGILYMKKENIRNKIIFSTLPIKIVNKLAAHSIKTNLAFYHCISFLTAICIFAQTEAVLHRKINFMNMYTSQSYHSRTL